MGYKIEKGSNGLINVTNNGSLELLGTFAYSSSGQPHKKQMFQRLDQAQVLLHKVKAHTNIIIKGNDFADKCAKTGRIHSSILWTETPSDPNCFLGSLCDYYTRCSHRMLLWHPSRGVD